MPRALVLSSLAVLACLLASGCGGDGSTTVIERTVTERAPGGEEGGAHASGANTGGVTPRAKALRLTGFQSPSGNIGCVLLGGTARCDIQKRNWSPPPRPPGCPDEVDFGQGLQVSRNDESGNFVCAGDTALNPAARKLAYGSSDRSGGFLCISRSSGITCTNSAGHGFFISIQSYRTF